MTTTTKCTTGAFQSTPSVGRATNACTLKELTAEISIHALRGEGDAALRMTALTEFRFQSTPSVGRATKECADSKRSQSISIHALRGEGDCGQLPLACLFCPHFNPRPPWGGRHFKPEKVYDFIYISIHALRGEGDRRYRRLFCLAFDFNPRPPWGGRPIF